jgi:hypothetical protein
MDRLRPAIQFEDAQRHQQGFGRHVVIDGLHRLGAPRLAVTREFADLDLGLGVDGDSQPVGIGRRLVAGALDVSEDRVGLGDFFSGRVF